MSTSIDQAFVRQYESEVHHLFQRQGGILRPTVRTKDNVNGKSTTFQRIGTGTADHESASRRDHPDEPGPQQRGVLPGGLLCG